LKIFIAKENLDAREAIRSANTLSVS